MFEIFGQATVEPTERQIQQALALGSFYLLLLFVFAGISWHLYSYWRKAPEDTEKAKRMKDWRKSLFMSSLWPLGGSLVTSITYWFMDGMYIAAWGPVLIGTVYLIKEAREYNEARRKYESGTRS